MNQTIVVGIGNPVLRDDTAGLVVIDHLQEQCKNKNIPVSFTKSYSYGLDLINDLSGYTKAILVDSMKTGKFETGYCHEFFLHDLPEMSPVMLDSHGFDLHSIMCTGKTLGFSMPDEMVIFGIEGADFHTFDELPSDEIRIKLPSIVKRILKRIRQWQT